MLKLAVWAAFYLSLIGMTVSVLLRSSKVRDAIATAWVHATDRAENPNFDGTHRLVHAFVSALYEGKAGRVSNKKVAALALLSSALWAAYLPQALGLWAKALSDSSLNFPRMSVVFAFVAMTVVTTPVHFAVESLIARWMLWVTRQPQSHTRTSLLVKVALATVLLYIGLLALLFATRVAGIETALSGYFELIAGPVTLPLLYYSGRIGPTDLGFALLPTAFAYANAVLLVALAVAIANSVPLLRVASAAMESLARQSAETLFGASVLLFSLATGLMQAWGF